MSPLLISIVLTMIWSIKRQPISLTNLKIYFSMEVSRGLFVRSAINIRIKLLSYIGTKQYQLTLLIKQMFLLILSNNKLLMFILDV